MKARPLERLAEAVREASGVVVGRRQLGSLQSALARALPGAHPEAVLEAFEEHEACPDLLQRVVDEVTVKESYFMREAAQLQSVDWRALLEVALARGSGRIRAWSAGCAGGQEAYTLAILASQAFGSSRPPVEIVATDISETALERAREGRFSRRAIRALPREMLDRHFDVADGGVAVREPLRDLVSFRRHNLARDQGPPGGEAPFDLVVCRNLLIYFDAAAVGQALSNLEAALAPDGVLLLGSADRLCVPRGRRPSRDPAPRSRSGRRERPRRRVETVETVEGSAAAPAIVPDDIDAAMAAARHALSTDPLSGEAYFLRATVEMSLDQPEAAIGSLRAALYASPGLGPAAFQLGRAYEAVGDLASARRAYEQALRTLDRDDDRQSGLIGHVDVGDVAHACAARIRELAGREGPSGRG